MMHDLSTAAGSGQARPYPDGADSVLAQVELRHLRCFLLIAEELNFTRAARRARMSQPSLTRTIRLLEKAVGTKLLDRTTRSVSLTPEGLRLKTDVQRLVGELATALDLRRGARPLRLGFTWLLPDGWTQETIAIFEKNSGARVEFTRHDEVYAGVDSGLTDIAVLRAPTALDGLRYIELFREGRVVAVSRTSPLAARGSLRWSELPDHPLVVNVVSGTTQADQWPDGRRPRIAAQCKNFDEWLETIAAGHGIGVVPALAEYRGPHPAVCFLPLDGAPAVPVCLAHPVQGCHPLVPEFVRAALEAEPPPYAL
jgi:DNA-binding transcriptional LysR family regulator